MQGPKSFSVQYRPTWRQRRKARKETFTYSGEKIDSFDATMGTMLKHMLGDEAGTAEGPYTHTYRPVDESRPLPNWNHGPEEQAAVDRYLKG